MITTYDAQKIRCQEDLEHIRALLQAPAFSKYFLRRLDEKINETSNRIVNEQLGHEETQCLRERISTLKKVKTLANDDQTELQRKLSQ